MYEKIVVPLDGSKLAECVLPYVEELAKGCGTKELILVSVTERVIGRTRAPETQEVYRASQEARIGLSGSGVMLTLGKKEKQALRYLDRVAKRRQKKGIKVRTEVLLGNPAEEITHFVEAGPRPTLSLWPVMGIQDPPGGPTAMLLIRSSELVACLS